MLERIKFENTEVVLSASVWRGKQTENPVVVLQLTQYMYLCSVH